VPRPKPRPQSIQSTGLQARALLAVLLFVASSCFSVAARAEASDDELIALGVNLRRDHRDAEALAAFQRAYAQQPTPRALAQVALAEQALSSWVRAEADLERALASTTDPWIIAHAALLNHALASIREHLATLTVESTAGTHLLLNGAEAGTLPLGPLRVPAGHATVVLRLDPDRELSHRLELPPGALVVDRVEFPTPPRAPEALPDHPRPNGAVGPLSESATSSARPAEATTPSTERTLAWCALGAAGTVLGASVVAELVHQSAAAHYNDDQRCAYGELSRDERCGVYRGRAQATRVMASGGYIGSGVLGVASLLLFWTSPERTPTAASTGRQPGSGELWLALDRGDARLGWRGTW
jgi:hypothetical protein